MLEKIPLSSCTAPLGLAAALCLMWPDPSSGQPSRQLPSSFDVFFAREGRVAPLFTRPDVRGWLPPLPAASDEGEPDEAAAAEPTPTPEETIARSVEQVLATPAKASTADTAPANEGGSAATPGPRNDMPASTAAVASTDGDKNPAPVGRFLSQGRAVWYQHPGRTASGETYNPDGLTAAHRTLPLGTRLRVVNRTNGRSVEVRVNDRMPSKLKYTIDLSRGSARALGIDGVGSVALYQLD